MQIVYIIYYILVYPISKLLFRIRAENRERIEEGAGIICANHSSNLDILVLAYALGRRHYIRFVAKKELLRIPVFGWLIRKAGTIGIERGGSDVGAMKAIMRALKEGEKVVIFPEGTRKREEEAGAGKAGVIMIASRTGAPIIPVNIPREKKLFRRIEVRIGEAYKIGKVRGGSEQYKEYAEELMEKIKELGIERRG